MKQSEYNFNSSELESSLKTFSEKGITEFSLHDEDLKNNKSKLIHFIQTASKDAPEVFYSFPVTPFALDAELIRNAQNIFCSIDVDMRAVKTQNSTKSNAKEPGAKNYLFDKKLFSKKATLLNNSGIVFGFTMDFAICPFDSLSAFRDRIDFALSLYPNHIDFPQMSAKNLGVLEKNTGTFSSQDIKYAKNIAFACRVFYSEGRAVPWFLSILAPLKIKTSRFFSDFAEWMQCNNCGFEFGFLPEEHSHEEIEKMQLLFLQMKYEEKKIEHLFPVVYDLVRLNGAFSRAAGENVECELNLSFNPDDLLSPESLDIISFAENVCMEECSVKVFIGNEGPDYRVI